MARGFDPANWPTERLLALVEPLSATAEAHRNHLQSVVDNLRTREVSWAAIAEKLGVSRQAAWERFS
jgi:ATP-dependent Clp protease ATP-binding subunit ClpX